MLRACATVLKPGGRLAFFTILISPASHGRDRERARAAGPPAVGTRRSYEGMLALAGFEAVTVEDVTPEFRRTSAAWLAGTERYAAELRRAHGNRDFARLLRQRRAHLAAVEEGLLVRALFSATRGARAPIDSQAASMAGGG